MKEAKVKNGKAIGNGDMQVVEVAREGQGLALGKLKNDPCRPGRGPQLRAHHQRRPE